MDTEIELTFDKQYLKDNLYQSDEYDYTPDDLTIVFSRKYIDIAKEILERYPDVDTVTFDACISSESFEGKLRGDTIRFGKSYQYINAIFNNDWSGTRYSMEIPTRLIPNFPETEVTT